MYTTDVFERVMPEFQLGVVISDILHHIPSDAFRVDFFPASTGDFAHVDYEVVPGQCFASHTACGIDFQACVQDGIGNLVATACPDVPGRLIRM